jgi:hypothetical protein
VRALSSFTTFSTFLFPILAGHQKCNPLLWCFFRVSSIEEYEYTCCYSCECLKMHAPAERRQSQKYATEKKQRHKILVSFSWCHQLTMCLLTHSVVVLFLEKLVASVGEMTDMSIVLMIKPCLQFSRSNPVTLNALMFKHLPDGGARHKTQ